jgi:hypothetical protein
VYRRGRRYSSASQSVLTRVIGFGLTFGCGYKFYEWMPFVLNLCYFFSKGNAGWYTPCLKSPSQTKLVYSLLNVPQARQIYISFVGCEFRRVSPLSYRSDMKITFSSQWRHNWQGLLYLNMSCFYISLVLYVISGEYLVVTPLSYRSDMKITFSSQWRDNWQGLDVGHRGAGVSFGCDIE